MGDDGRMGERDGRKIQPSGGYWAGLGRGRLRALGTLGYVS